MKMHASIPFYFNHLTSFYSFLISNVSCSPPFFFLKLSLNSAKPRYVMADSDALPPVLSRKNKRGGMAVAVLTASFLIDRSV